MAASHPEAGLLYGFRRSVRTHPSRPALRVAGEEVTYEALDRRASALAQLLDSRAPESHHRRTAVLAHRSVTAYAGVLGALLRGHAYVPLNPRFPMARTIDMLDRSGARAIIVDGAGERVLDGVLDGCAEQMAIVLPDRDEVGAVAARHSRHRVISGVDIARAECDDSVIQRPSSGEAYLLFTSGSTGRPKGVPITDASVTAYVRAVTGHLDLDETDRCSQIFDLTFDLSVHDMFVTWERGACLCVPTDKVLMKPSGFITGEELTVWFSVPTLAILMQRFGGLRPAVYPSLRWALFCGEALPVEVADSFATAAPRAAVENLYGPTEATIACTTYRWDRSSSRSVARMGVVPIGRPLPGVDVLVVDHDLRPVAEEVPGELLVAGPQVARGYLDDAERTVDAFVAPPGRVGMHYRTGDRVVQDGDGILHFLGRIDSQVKVNGHRVELGEVEAALREQDAVDEAVVLAWPQTGPGTSSGLVAFVTTSGPDTDDLRQRLAARLPAYMVPHAVHALPTIPKNANGKYDRRALRAALEEMT